MQFIQQKYNYNLYLNTIIIFSKLCTEYGNASTILNHGLLENILVALNQENIPHIRKEILLLLSNLVCEERVSATRVADSEAFTLVIGIASNPTSDLECRLESIFVVCNVLTTAEPSLVAARYPQILRTILGNLPAMKNNRNVLLLMLESVLVLIRVMDQGQVL